MTTLSKWDNLDRKSIGHLSQRFIDKIVERWHKTKRDAHEEEDDDKLAKHKGVDSDDEDNTKRIFLSQVRVSRQGKDSLRSKHDDGSSGYDSEHSYKFVIGGR